MRDCWQNLQADVARCIRCRTELSDVNVECPPGVLYPPSIAPLDSVRVLFIGVAPPKTGRHFYTDPSDNLRLGLFDVLRELDRPCRGIPDFIGRGFFLVHTAKCAIHATTRPNLRVSKICTSTHLGREIECLLPDGLCFLSKNIGFPVFSDLLLRWGGIGPLRFGEVTPIVIGGKTVQTISTTWPGRPVHKPATKGHVRSLFSILKIPTWQ